MSSSTVEVAGATTQEVGDSGERVLSKDIGLLRNDAPEGGRICICASEMVARQSNRCNIAPVVAPISAGCNIPDFVSDDFIAEAKNVALLQSTDQLRAFILMATEMKRPLWIYVRTDTNVVDELVSRVSETGGGIVWYFRPPGIVDEWAERGKVVAAFSIVTILALVFFPNLPSGPRRPHPVPKPKQPPSSPIDELERLQKRTRENTQRRIDEEDSRIP